MRFFLDNDVPASVGQMLRRRGHECWTAAQAGIADEAADDNLGAYAGDKDAALVTLDKEFSRRRLHNTIGKHVKLRCREPQAARLLGEHLDEVLELLRGREHVLVAVSEDGVRSYTEWQ